MCANRPRPRICACLDSTGDLEPTCFHAHAVPSDSGILVLSPTNSGNIVEGSLSEREYPEILTSFRARVKLRMELFSFRKAVISFIRARYRHLAHISRHFRYSPRDIRARDSSAIVYYTCVTSDLRRLPRHRLTYERVSVTARNIRNAYYVYIFVCITSEVAIR